MARIISDLGVLCLILAPFLLSLGVGGGLLELAVDRIPAFRSFLERVFGIDLS